MPFSSCLCPGIGRFPDAALTRAAGVYLTNQLSAGRLPRRASDLGRWSDTGTRAGRTSGLERTRGAALERFPPGARISNCLWATCCGSRFIAAWAGYEDVNDAERLSHDPTFRL